MDVIFKKTEELKHLLIGKSLSEQKEIILKFFYENRNLNKLFKLFYKSTKNIFENSSLSDSYIQYFINKTFINREEMFYYSTFNEFNNGTKFNIDKEEFETFTSIKKIIEHIDKLIWNDEDPNDLTEKQKDLMIKNEKWNIFKENGEL